MTSHNQREEISDRRPGDEEPGSRLGKAERLDHPSRDLMFHLDADVIAPAAIGVEAGCEHLGDHPDRRASAMHPAHERRMSVSGRIGFDRSLELFERFLEGGAFFRQISLETRTDFWWRGDPHGSLPQRAQVIDHAVKRRARLGAKRVPIVWIKFRTPCHDAARFWGSAAAAKLDREDLRKPGFESAFRRSIDSKAMKIFSIFLGL